ncbi:MAG TPA: hypothetical protein VFM42_09040, partial [Sphingomicrobium sp.]|nr:hypothetical protein [Sphingomicrobium sp.]
HSPERSKLMNRILPVAALAAVIAVPATAALPAVSVPLGTVQQFVGRSDSLYVQTGGNWYRAEMASPCWQLEPDRNRLRIALGADGRFDSSSTVRVNNELCPIAFVTPSNGPPLPLLLNPDG